DVADLLAEVERLRDERMIDLEALRVAAADPMMTAPDVCLYCGVLLARDAGGVRHRSESPCRDPRPCEDRERELRWDDWLTDPPWARPPARGGAPHIVRY